VGFFQYESAGMQKYMKEWPTFPDLFCRTLGPIAYIPSFVKGKMGRGYL
jgi:hypothetical protein